MFQIPGTILGEISPPQSGSCKDQQFQYISEIPGCAKLEAKQIEAQI